MIDENTTYVEKPSDWPQNQREARLSNIEYAIEKFRTEPNYGNKEILLSLLVELDPNQYDSFGMTRITAYEVALINKLYFLAKAMNLSDLELYLYKEITETTRLVNMLLKMDIGVMESHDFDKYGGLILPLKLYFIAYQNYNYCKQRSFCDELLDAVNIFETFEKQGKIFLKDIEYAFINLLYDLSNASGINTIPVIEFNRDELLKLLKKGFELVKKQGIIQIDDH